MNNLKNKIDYLISLGLDFNLNNGYESLINDLANFGILEDENYPIWLIIREMGNLYGVDKNLNRLSENISTIIYDEFFIHNKISDIFLELKRISKHKFKFEIIKEFGSTESDSEYWRELDKNQGKSFFECVYKIDDQEFKIIYNFFEYNWIVLNPEFIDDLCAKFDKLFFKLNINYFSEEYITFFCLPQTSQEVLVKEPTIFLIKSLVKKYRKSDFQIQQEKIAQEKLKRINEEAELFSTGKVNNKTASQSELKLLENYKEKKLQEVYISLIGALIILVLLTLGLNSDVLNITPVKVVLWFFICWVILFSIFIVIDSKIWTINRDLKSKIVVRAISIVTKVNHINGETIVSFKKGEGPKFIKLDYFLDLNKEDEVILNIFKESKVFLLLENFNRKKSTIINTKNSNVIIFIDKCPACLAIVGEQDYECLECGLKFI